MDNTAKSVATPWTLYVVALVIIVGVFLPPPVLRLVRRRNRS
ncbi:hypothetical protein ACFQYP_02235 [Nonomuraea antimicrobica]